MERKSAPLNIEKVTHVRASICAEGFHIIYIYIYQPVKPRFFHQRHETTCFKLIQYHQQAFFSHILNQCRNNLKPLSRWLVSLGLFFVDLE